MGVVPLQELDAGPVRVLLVEDELFVRMDIAAALRHAGFQVIEAACADAAMEFIESGEPIDLVFTDIQTPGILDGLALAERVRAKYPLMPVLICSGNLELEGAASRLGKFVRADGSRTAHHKLNTVINGTCNDLGSGARHSCAAAPCSISPRLRLSRLGGGQCHRGE